MLTHGRLILENKFGGMVMFRCLLFNAIVWHIVTYRSACLQWWWWWWRWQQQWRQWLIPSVDRWLPFYWGSLTARFMGSTWGPSGADRTQVGPMLALWTLLSGNWEGLLGLLWWTPSEVENTIVGSALGGTVFDLPRILAYLVHSIR